MEARKVKCGQLVQAKAFVHRPIMPNGRKTPAAGVWAVLDRSPRPACWWLHRWEGDQWLVVEAKAAELELVGNPGELS